MLVPSDPSLTVAVPTFNRWASLTVTLKALLGQKQPLAQIIVVDDNSDSHPPKVIRNLLILEEVKYVRHSSNKGLAAARNTAIREAETDFIGFCDDDDYWPPEFTMNVVAQLGEAPDDVEGCLSIKGFGSSCNLPLFPTLKELILKGITPPVSGQVYSTGLLRRIGGYQGRVESGVDHDLWISLLEENPRFAICGEVSPIVSTNSVDRLTTDEKVRREGIERALQIWRVPLTRHFGEEFFTHFVRSYYRHMEWSFLKNAIARGDIRAIVKNLLIWSNVTRIITGMMRRLMRKEPCGAFPTFRN